MASDAVTAPHEEAKRLVARLLAVAPRGSRGIDEIPRLPEAKSLLGADKTIRTAALRECADHRIRLASGAPDAPDVRLYRLTVQLLRRDLPFTAADLVYLVSREAEESRQSAHPYLLKLIDFVEERSQGDGISAAMGAALLRLERALEWIGNAPERKLRERIARLRGGPQELPLESGEAWSDQAIADLRVADATDRAAWIALLDHCRRADGAAPSKNWIAGAAAALDRLGRDGFTRRVPTWFALVNRPRTQPVANWPDHVPNPNLTIIEPHMDILKALAWICGVLGDERLARPLSDLARSAYRKVPAVGPRAVKVGNACVWALGAMPSPLAVGQLSVLRAGVKFGTAQKMIEKAFTKAAESLGLPRDQIEEMGVPSYGMEEVGLRRELFGDAFAAELRVDGRDVTLCWLRSDGKPQKSIPAKVKSQYKEELKELQAAAKDISAMLPAQAERIDSMFLLQKRWALPAWRERYLEHPLVGTIARRLIWAFRSGDREQAGIWVGGRLVNVDDAPLDLTDDAQVELWHPIGRPMDDVLAWRAWLQRHEVRQPFKQAHREVYLLTDAERRTRTYSNRFAAHILRQHQFNALCAARGWKNKLRLLVDDTYPPASRELPNWGLRAEFWIEGIGDNYGQDTTDSGAFLRISTDQVRFHRLAAGANRAHASGGGYECRAGGPGDQNMNDPLPLEQVPPLVLSEIMRDADLFVGVASVGNDPTWQDGGPEGRYRAYWQDYNFGALSETALTRRAVLETLLPRLSKIRERCSLDGRFLVVRGDLRTYKIHLGSGNILMAPDDQYLCIVPDRSSGSAANVFLPFEGDATLSIILSKAFLVAEDTKIDDPTITRQIRQGPR